MNYMQWIPVSERKPDEELQAYRDKYGRYAIREFIVYISDAVCSTVLWYDGRGFFQDNDEPWDDAYDREYYDDVTHWMSLPPTPAECKKVIDLGDDISANYEMFEAIFT